MAEGQATLDRQTYLLISARVKGGNSGGPVINRRGEVVGVVSATPSGAGRQFDSLGYGAVIPSTTLRDLLAAIEQGRSEAISAAFEQNETGFHLRL
ncbi:Trypsin family protein (fragment) [Verrucomicrobia bacterium]